jgi:hypothetical protein
MKTEGTEELGSDFALGVRDRRDARIMRKRA